MIIIKDFLKNECAGWKLWELAWLAAACSIILTLSLYWGDNIIGIISSVSGTICVIFTGKGKLSAYIFGAVNTLLYALISFEARYYGEVMLNLLYYFPMQFYGFYVWSRHMNADTHEVTKRNMCAKGRIVMCAAVAACTLLYGFLLRILGGMLPFVDALSTVASVAAMIISIWMYSEQWILWIAIDVVTIFMWAYAFMNGSESIATLIMWIVYLVNAVIMYIKWNSEARSREI